LPLQRQDSAGAHQALIAREIVTARFVLAEPVEGVEIGDGAKVAIAKV
jgi:isoleucyl-tRNA synthetase